MLTELFFVFICKENQERTNIELGEMKGIFYQNPLIIVFIFTVAVFGATDDLPTTFLYPSLLLHVVRLSLSCSYGSFCLSKVC